MVKDKIIALIESNVNVEYISIRDRTAGHKHHKHYDGGGHYKINLISDDFENISLLDRHKKIYLILKDMIIKEIHAVSLNLSTVKEYTKKSEAR